MLPTYRHICRFLRGMGADVLSWHVADPALDEKESKMSEREIYDRDIGLLKRSECLIADVTIPSIGVGYEICSGLGMRLPVLCVHKHGANVSAMLLGNSGRNMIVEEYDNLEQLENIISGFVDSVGKSQIGSND